VKIMFNMLDLDHDGYISTDELREVFSKNLTLNLPTSQEKVFQDIMHEIDVDNDNIITFEEFNNGITRLLEKQANIDLKTAMVLRGKMDKTIPKILKDTYICSKFFTDLSVLDTKIRDMK